MPGADDVLRPVLLVLALGLVVGVAWWALAPTGPVVVAQGYLVPVGTASSGPPSDVLGASQDAVFAVLCAAAGAACGSVLVARPGSGRGAVVRWVAVVVAGLVAAALALAVGVLLGPASVAAQQQAGADMIASPLRLSSPAPLLVWSATTCTVVFVASIRRALHRPART